MKVVKPQKVGALTRVIEHGGRCHFVVGAVGFFPLGNPAPLTEVDLWKFVPKALPEGAVFDAAMPKSRGEVLVHGRCFAPGGSARQCAARVKLGAVDKSLYVFGDRRWQDGEATEPAPFESMPLDWTRAFGGEGFTLNPLGKGAVAVGGAHPLPNVESPSARVTHPGDRPSPASFTAVDFTWPQRASKRGTYDQAWLDLHYPGLAPDIDWTIFNDAQPDQWIDGYWRGDEALSLTNLHPTRAVLEASLPGFTARAFVTLQPDGSESEPEPDALREVPLRLDTVHLFPEAERVVLVWRGTVEVREDDGVDLRHLLLAMEDLGAPRDLDHYRAVLTKRLDKKRGAVEALRDRDLMPPPREDAFLVRSSTDDFEDALTFEGHAEQNAARFAEKQREETREQLRARGLDPDVYGPPPPPPALAPRLPDEDPDAYVERMQVEVEATMSTPSQAEREEAVREGLKSLCAEHGLDFETLTAGGQRPTFSADEEMEKLRGIVGEVRVAGASSPELEAMLSDPAFHERMRAAEAALAESRLKHGHLFPEGPPRSPTEAARLRAWVESRLSSGEGIAGADLAGADLTSMDLSGANLRGCQLDGARLAGSSLRMATLADAVLARADLTSVDLTRANLIGANLGRATLPRARLDGADLTRAVLAEANLDGATAVGVTLAKADLYRASLASVDLSGVDLSGAALLEVKLGGAKLDGAKLVKATLLECVISGASFVEADLTGAVLCTVTGDGAVFREARADNLRVVVGCSLVDANFLAASLRGATLRETKMDRVDLRRAVLDEADLSGSSLRDAKIHQASARGSRWIRTDLRGAGMVHIDLMDALLTKADLRGADLQGASLYGADLFRSKGDRSTVLTDIYAAKARIDRRRDAEG